MFSMWDRLQSVGHDQAELKKEFRVLQKDVNEMLTMMKALLKTQQQSETVLETS